MGPLNSRLTPIKEDPMLSPLLEGSKDGNVAVRSDPKRRYREEAMFLGRDALKMFACAYIPERQPIGIVVVCPSVLEDFRRNYRREVLLARSLVRRNVAVLRFHYRGCGNSDGDSNDLSLESMVEDTLFAVEWLKARVGSDPTVLVGTRLGSFPAAITSRLKGSALTLWDPVVEPIPYFREAFRARLIRELGRGGGGTSISIDEEMRSKGSVDVIGYSIGRRLYEDLAGRRLKDEIGEQKRSLLLAQIRPGSSLRDEYVSLARSLGERGFSVATVVLDGNESWGFESVRWQAEESRHETQGVLKATTDFVERELRGRGEDDQRSDVA
jgi:predicted alpha/beta hydrolase